MIEGRQAYHAVHPTLWESAPPAVLVQGSAVDLNVAIRPALFEPGVEITRVTADLSTLGGPEAVELTAAGDGTYQLQTSLTAGGDRDLKMVSILIEQATSLGPHWTKSSRTITVEPMAVEGQTFTEVGALAGINGYGIVTVPAWADCDNDGDLDLFLAHNGKNRWYQNNGDGTFTDRIEQLGLQSNAWDIGPAWADYDNDGDLDLFLASSGTDRLYQNGGDGTFTDVAEVSGVGDARFGIGSAWADYDNDGDLDLYVANWGEPNGFYQNAGDGTFADVAEILGVDGGAQVSFNASWADYDNDGDADLYIGNQGDNPNRLYQNGGDGAFTDVAETAGVDLFGIPDIAGTNMGWADYDNDGDLDLAVTRAALEFAPAFMADVKTFLFRNNGNGAFTEVTGAAGVDDLEKAGKYDGAVWADYDNDGDLDLFRNNGDRPSRLFRNEGNGTFTDVAETAGVEGSNEGAVAWADYDNDGDLDLFASPGNVPDRLYRNDGPRQRWLHMELAGSASNRSGVGAVATVVTGNRRQRRDVVSRAAGGSSLPLEFGLGNAAKVDSLITVWPSGRVDVRTNLAVDRFIRVVEGAATAVLEDRADIRPQAFALWQNYPNPFNGGTVFRFALPARQPVELAVYNLMGQEVARLVDGMRPAGAYTVHWDGTDAQDRDLASGLYLYRLQAGVRTATKKLLLLR